jgi:hypothetical protein
MTVKLLAAVSRVTGKEPLLSEFNIYMLNRNNEFDCSKAERELGFRCRPFSESIRDTVNWLRAEGFLESDEGAQVLTVSPQSLLRRLCSALVIQAENEGNAPTDKPVVWMIAGRFIRLILHRICEEQAACLPPYSAHSRTQM